MNTNAPVMDRLRSLADLVAALPYFIGYHPRDSLVVVTVRPGTPATVGPVLRGDLPPPGAEHLLVDEICTPLSSGAGIAVLLVVVGGPAHPAHPAKGTPAVVEPLRTALAGIGIEVLHAAWAESTTPGARWACLDDATHTGVVPDVSSSPLAAATTAAGMVTHADREGLRRLVTPDDDAALERRARMLDHAARAAELDRSQDGPVAVAHNLRLVRSAVRSAAGGRLPTTDHEVVELAVALSDPLVRDRVLGLCLGHTADPAERLWLALTRATPPPEVAEPAALAALSAYLRGDGALANMALDRALDAWPGHVLATLADQVLRSGVAPWRLHQLVSDACTDAAIDLADYGVADEPDPD